MNPLAVWGNEVDGPGGNVIGGVVWVWCPGCDSAHRFTVDSVSPERIAWEWNGSLESPSFEPSYLTWGTRYNDANGAKTDHEHGTASEWRCHSFLRDGVWDFLGDSTHALAGQKVPMVPVPDWLVRERTEDPL